MTDYIDQPLFDVQQRITPEHIEVIWRLATLPDYDDAAAEKKSRAVELANQNVDTAADFLSSQSYFNYTDNGDGKNEKLAQIREEFKRALTNPEDLPKLHPVPTLDDCQRLADTGTESGRCLAWLTGVWPNEGNYPPSPTPLGDRDGEPGSSWAYFMDDSVSIHTALENHPYAEKTVFKFGGLATQQQLVGAARWLLAKAGEAA